MIKFLDAWASVSTLHIISLVFITYKRRTKLSFRIQKYLQYVKGTSNTSISSSPHFTAQYSFPLCTKVLIHLAFIKHSIKLLFQKQKNKIIYKYIYIKLQSIGRYRCLGKLKEISINLSFLDPQNNYKNKLNNQGFCSEYINKTYKIII